VVCLSLITRIPILDPLLGIIQLSLLVPIANVRPGLVSAALLLPAEMFNHTTAQSTCLGDTGVRLFKGVAPYSGIT
jgi:hypothetical protein